MSAHTPGKATEKDIDRWQRLTYVRPDGPWELGNGGSFDRQEVRPISDEMMAELAAWLHLGYTPWNGRSMPLSTGDRQFMYMLYFSAQGLVTRMRAAERQAAAVPLMLEALRRVTDRMERVFDLEYGIGTGKADPAVKAARAAIAAATGEKA